MRRWRPRKRFPAPVLRCAQLCNPSGAAVSSRQPAFRPRVCAVLPTHAFLQQQRGSVPLRTCSSRRWRPTRRPRGLRVSRSGYAASCAQPRALPAPQPVRDRGVPSRKPFLNLRGSDLRCRQRPVPVVLRPIAFFPQLSALSRGKRRRVAGPHKRRDEGTHSCGCERRGTRRTSTCSSASASCGGRTARIACGSCCGACRTTRFPCLQRAAVSVSCAVVGEQGRPAARCHHSRQRWRKRDSPHLPIAGNYNNWGLEKGPLIRRRRRRAPPAARGRGPVAVAGAGAPLSTFTTGAGTPPA